MQKELWLGRRSYDVFGFISASDELMLSRRKNRLILRENENLINVFVFFVNNNHIDITGIISIRMFKSLG